MLSHLPPKLPRAGAGAAPSSKHGWMTSFDPCLRIDRKLLNRLQQRVGFTLTDAAGDMILQRVPFHAAVIEVRRDTKSRPVRSEAMMVEALRYWLARREARVRRDDRSTAHRMRLTRRTPE